MVEDVEEFRSEFELHLLANRKLLDEGSVPGFVSRPLDDVAPAIPERSLNIVMRKRTGIELRPGHARSAIRIANPVGTRAIKSDGAAAIGIGDGDNIRSGVVIAGGCGKDAAHLPISKNLIHKTGSVLCEHAPATEWQIIDVTEYKTMTNVKVGIPIFRVGKTLVAKISIVHRSQAGA